MQLCVCVFVFVCECSSCVQLSQNLCAKNVTEEKSHVQCMFKLEMLTKVACVILTKVSVHYRKLVLHLVKKYLRHVVTACANQVCKRIHGDINRLLFCSKIMFQFNMGPEQSAAFDLHQQNPAYG